MIASVIFYPGGVTERSPRASLVEWLVEPDAPILPGTPLFSYEIDKAVATFNSPVAGYVKCLLVEKGGRFTRGQPVALVADRAEETPSDDAKYPDAVGGNAEEDDFDWDEIDNRGGAPVPLGVMRRTIALRMAMSKRHIPCFYLAARVDMGFCLARRAEMRHAAGRAATINDMVVKAAALALVKHPKAAAVYTPAGIIPRDEINIGFAAALPDDGLVVPVIKRANEKSLADIAGETRALAAKAKRGELTPDDCSGGVFSVSYLGAYEVDSFVAIVNPGEAAIAAVGRMVDTPVVRDGTIVIRPMTEITLSCDHRSIDGALAARLMGDIKYFLEHAEEL